MPATRRLFFLCLASAFAACSACGVAAARAGEPGWPEKVVALEELQPLTPFRLKVRRVISKGPVQGPSVVKAHIDEAGAVQRVALVTSCGNGEIDEAAILALRDMRFQPYLGSGVPTAVTLLLPVHIPKAWGRKD